MAMKFSRTWRLNDDEGLLPCETALNIGDDFGIEAVVGCGWDRYMYYLFVPSIMDAANSTASVTF